MSKEILEDLFAAYNVLAVYVVNLQCPHGIDEGLDGYEDVLVDQLGEAHPVGLIIARAMDDPHLLDESALPALSSPWVRR